MENVNSNLQSDSANLNTEMDTGINTERDRQMHTEQESEQDTYSDSSSDSDLSCLDDEDKKVCNIDKFRKLGISEPILRVIEEERFEDPSEIQLKSIPLVLAGKDVIAMSKTGSGKTLAFASKIIQSADRGRGIQTLVLTPTRELAEQVSMAIKKFSKYKHLSVEAIYGGVSINPQFSHLQHADIVVGTPGRILDHIERRTINLSNVKILVLDEADRMLDMGFLPDVKNIISRCPAQRQTMLFSATIPEEINDLVRTFMKNPSKVSVDCFVDPKKLTQFYYDVQENQKISLLAHLLKKDKTSGLVMVFCNTKHVTRFVAKNLRGAGINAVDLHGGLSQNQRQRVLQSFHSSQVDVLVCTDVAARGLDIPGVTHIYNYNVPNDEKQYIHRIGRTARAEKDGMAVNLISERDHENFSRVMRYNDVTVNKIELPAFERLALSFTMQKREFGSGGGHGSGGYRGHGGHGGGRRFGGGDRGGRSNADHTQGSSPHHSGAKSQGYGNRGRSHNWRHGRN